METLTEGQGGRSVGTNKPGKLIIHHENSDKLDIKNVLQLLRMKTKLIFTIDF